MDAAAAIEATLAVTEASENEEACRGRMFGRGTDASVGSLAPWAAASCCSAAGPMRPRKAVQLESTTPASALLAESAVDPTISVT